MSIQGGPDIVENGLVLYLDAGNRRSYMGSGTSWLDLSGNGNTGTLTNGPTFDGGNGGSIVFDGVNDYVSLGNNFLVSTSQPFTINIWFNITVKVNAFQRIITLDALNTEGFGVALRDGSSNGYTGLYVTSAGGWIRGSTGQQLTSNIWRMLTYTYNGTGSTSTANFSMYLNATQLNLATTGAEAISNSTKFNIIGTRFEGDNQFFSGKVSTATLYNRVLSPQEILQNYNATRSRFGV